MRNWILIFALLGLHGCKVFNPESAFYKYSSFIINDAGSEVGVCAADHSDESDSFSRGLHLHAVAGEEEQEHFLLIPHSYSLSSFNPFSIGAAKISCYIRNFLEDVPVPIYLFCKSLIL
jgi:hypothetical protein